MLHAALRSVLAGEVLDRETTRDVFAHAVDGEADPVQLGGLLVALAGRGESAPEIAGVADALRARMRPFEHDHARAIDTAGTGGDGLGSFNLSTAAALVAAAAGARVIKHGNRKVSSRCGSADLLQAAGLPLELAPEAARTVLDEVGITFLFAPAYHPALRAAADVRRALGVRTVFNLVGPLLNPGRVRRQVLGVSEARHGPLLAAVLTELGHERAYVVHGDGGADELTLGPDNTTWTVGDAPEGSFDPAPLGLSAAPVEALAGGDAAHNLGLLHAVLAGEAGPLADAVVLNAAAALLVADAAVDAIEGIASAREALASGAAARTLQAWVRTAGACCSEPA